MSGAGTRPNINVKALCEEVRKGVMKTRAEIVENLLKLGRIGWAFDPRKGKEVVVEHATGCVVQGDGVPAPRTRQIRHPREIKITPTTYRSESGFFEGVVQHMYQDPNGHVTVGIGHKLDDAEAAKNLQFYMPPDEPGENIQKPTLEEIEDEFNVVRKPKYKDYSLRDFRIMTDLRLDPGYIEELFDADVDKFIGELGETFTEFATYPKTAQLGMLDLAYNLGTRGFFDGFTDFGEALRFRDWITVAKESHRKIRDKNNKIMGGMVNRNKIVQTWFLNAIKDEPLFVNPHCPQKNVPMVRGYVT